jgi:hypothetical protein
VSGDAESRRASPLCLESDDNRPCARSTPPERRPTHSGSIRRERFAPGRRLLSSSGDVDEHAEATPELVGSPIPRRASDLFGTPPTPAFPLTASPSQTHTPDRPLGSDTRAFGQSVHTGPALIPDVAAAVMPVHTSRHRAPAARPTPYSPTRPDRAVDQQVDQQRCTRQSERPSDQHFCCSEGLSEVGDTGIEPVTSSV